MEAIRDSYFTAYPSLKLTRDAEGVLVVQLHSNGGPLTFTAQAHTEVVDAFYRISQDRANKIVILTGAGGDFMIGVDWSSFTNASDPGVWSQIHDEGAQVLENIANIRVPVIGELSGRVRRAFFGRTYFWFLTGGLTLMKSLSHFWCLPDLVGRPPGKVWSSIWRSEIRSCSAHRQLGSLWLLDPATWYPKSLTLPLWMP